MADISIQFHALPEEILPVVNAFVDEIRPYVIGMRFHPFEAWLVERPQIMDVMRDETVRRIAFLPGNPVLPVGKMTELIDRNPDVLMLEIGRRGDEGLKESWLTARTGNEAALEAWRKLAKKIRSITKTGAIAVNPSTGVTAKLKDHRFSEGAKRLEAQGVPILPAAGTSRLRFPENPGNAKPV
jgi:hypothetical protein